MKLFELTLENHIPETEAEDECGARHETEVPEDFHPYAEAENAEQAQYLSKVLNTIDSLERARHNLSNTEETNLSFEGFKALADRVTLAYTQNDLEEEFPIHVSRESFNYHFGKDNGIALAIEKLDERIFDLSTEANNFFARFWRDTKEIFGKEFNRIERIKDNLRNLLSELESSPDWDTGGSLVVKNAAAITHNGKLDMGYVTNSLDGLIKNHLMNGKFMDTYYTELTQACQFFDKSNWDDPEKIKKEMERKQFFRLGKPFTEIRSNDSDFNQYLVEVSDLNSMVVNMPKGGDKLIPPTPFANQNKIQRDWSGKSAAKESYDQTLPRMPKQELTKHIRALLNAIENLPNASQFNAISNSIKKQIENLTKSNFTLKNHQKADTSWNSKDWDAVAGGLVIPFVMLALLGPSGLLGLRFVQGASQLLNFVSHIASSDAEHNVSRNTTEEIPGFLKGGIMGLDWVLVNGLILKKYTNSFENKITLYFIGVYREVYAMVRSTANAFLSYGYSSMGKSNKY